MSEADIMHVHNIICAHSHTGYVPCGCRDCMEIAVGNMGALCFMCHEAGCEASENLECRVEPELEESSGSG